MEEVKCFLLGFGSHPLSRHRGDSNGDNDDGGPAATSTTADGPPSPKQQQQQQQGRIRRSSGKAGESPLASSFTYPSTQQHPSSSSSPSPSADGEWLSPWLRGRLHPAEVHQLSALLPLGEHYAFLAAAAQRTAVGRTEGLYPCALAAAVSRILRRYAGDVKAAATPSALAALRSAYGTTLERLTGMVRISQEQEQQQGQSDAGPASPSSPRASDADRNEESPGSGGGGGALPISPSSPATAWLLAAIQAFVSHKEVPLAFRQTLGVCVLQAVLYTTAHYVAHGVVLHGRRDYFISVAPASAAAGRATEQHTLHTDLLPSGIGVDLGMLILTAGRERRVLLSEADSGNTDSNSNIGGGSGHLEQLAMGTQDVAADAVFRAVFNLSLCEGGTLAADELTARVEAARALWSKALWTRVGSSTALAENLEALQVAFLCTRGDLWLGFVERCFDALSGMDTSLSSSSPLASSSSSHTASGGGLTSRRGVMMPRAVAESDTGAASGKRRSASSAKGNSSTSGGGGFSWAAAQRAVAEAFTHALSVSGLAERPVYRGYRVHLAAPQSPDEEAAFYGPRGATRSVEAAAQLLLDRAQGIGLRFASPPGLQLVVSVKALGYYQRLFSLHLGMRFATYAVHQTRQLFSGAIMTNARPSDDLRRAYALYQRLSFLLSALGYYYQVDVIALPAAQLAEHVSRCRSVEEAKRRHDGFIWSVAEGSFLTEGSETLHAACRALCECAVTLFVLCTRFRLNYWAVEGLNRTPIEVAASLAALETRVQYKVVAAFTASLSSSTRQLERALWARVDFNRFFSYRPVGAAGGSGGGGGGGSGSSGGGGSSYSSGGVMQGPLLGGGGSGGADRWRTVPRADGDAAAAAAAASASAAQDDGSIGGFARPRRSTVNPITTATTATTAGQQHLQFQSQELSGPQAPAQVTTRWRGSSILGTKRRAVKHADASMDSSHDAAPTATAITTPSGRDEESESRTRTVITSAATKFKRTEK